MDFWMNLGHNTVMKKVQKNKVKTQEMDIIILSLTGGMP